MASKAEFQSAKELGYEQAVKEMCRRICPLNDDVTTIEQLEQYLREQSVTSYTHGFEEGKKVARGDVFCQEIYDDGYKQGKKDTEARFEIGLAYANKSQMRDLEAINKLVQNNPKCSEEYKQAYNEFTERYLGTGLD